MSKHTPGPWVAEPGGGKGSWVKGSTGEWAALACGDTSESAEANARLIAAAPDMLKALRPFAEVDYEELIGAPDDMPIEEALRKAGQPTVGDLRRAMDAVDKAEGQS